MTDSPSADTLTRLSRFAQEARDRAAEIARLEESLKAATESYNRIVERDIPDLMDEVGVSDFRLSDGTRITIKEDIRASIPAARRNEAVSWFDDHGLSGMVKRTFTISFGRDEESWANKFEADLRKRKREVNLKKEYKVEPMTLKAWVKTALENGQDLDPELFGIFRQRKAKVD